ncbi:MAG: (2Fe-2S)-binding protein [bacterium]|nr:(2Fe-2S)-binding protein [bacterium]
MVVCHCKAINAEFITSLFAEKSFSVADVTEQCGAGSDCGRCLDLIECLLEQNPAVRGRQVAVGIS